MSARKPIEWACHDHDCFKSAARANLNEESGQLAQEPRLRDNSSFALTDGSAREVPRKRQCAGSFFCGSDGVSTLRRQIAGGSLWTSANLDRRWVLRGRHPCQNNTGEMHGLIEALFWHNTYVEQGVLQASSPVIVTVSSLSVKGLVDDTFVARKNPVLTTPLRHMRRLTEKPHG